MVKAGKYSGKFFVAIGRLAVREPITLYRARVTAWSKGYRIPRVIANHNAEGGRSCRKISLKDLTRQPHIGGSSVRDSFKPHMA